MDSEVRCGVDVGMGSMRHITPIQLSDMSEMCREHRAAPILHSCFKGAQVLVMFSGHMSSWWLLSQWRKTLEEAA